MPKAAKQDDTLDTLDDDLDQEPDVSNLTLADMADETDVEILAAFADSAGDPDEHDDPRPNADGQEFKGRSTESAKDLEPAKEPDKVEDVKEEKESEDIKADKEDTGKEESAEKEKDNLREESGDVATRDGKHIIPFSVLETARNRAAAEKEKADILAAETEALRAQLAEAQRQPIPVEQRLEKPADNDGLSAEDKKAIQAIRDQIDAVQKDYDDIGDARMADPMIGNLEMTIRAIQENAQLKVRLQALESRPSADEVGERERIQFAIDNSPIILGWQQENPAMYDVAVKTYHAAMANDPEFAALALGARFQQLPTLVAETANIVIPGLDTAENAPKEQPKEEGLETPEKESRDKEIPMSSSAIAGGSTPEGGKHGPMDNMSGQAMTDHFQQKLDQGGNLDDILANLA